MSPFAELITVATAAVHALRSYQYGNASPDLAQTVADKLTAAIQKALEAQESPAEGPKER